MIWGLSTSTFTLVHVVLSLVGIFVLVVQLFLKVPALKALAPTQKEPPFVIAQLDVLLLLAVPAGLATVRFRPEPKPAG